MFMQWSQVKFVKSLNLTQLRSSQQIAVIIMGRGKFRRRHGGNRDAQKQDRDGEGGGQGQVVFLFIINSSRSRSFYISASPLALL